MPNGELRPETPLISRETLRSIEVSVARPCGLLFLVASLIGALDDLQVRYVGVANLGTNAEVLYQSCFMVAAAAGAYLVLHRKAWSLSRNLTNLMMSVPVAAMADNVSIDAGTLRPYVFAIPGQGYEWRQTVFGHTAGLDKVAGLVNQQSLAPGVLDGYIAAVAVAAGYVALQYAMHRRANRTVLGTAPKSPA